MKIDIHRHASNRGAADKVLRNLFHHQHLEIEQQEMCSVGLHPWHVNEGTLISDLLTVKHSAWNKNVLAIGEAGLDKVKNIDYNIQERAFRRQIEIAFDAEKPMIIHCVKAYNELIQLHKEYQPVRPWVIHWFYASPEMAHQLIDRGFYLSFGLTLFHEKSKAFRAFHMLPLNKIFFETDDAQYSINEIYKKASELRGIEMQELESIIEHNFNTCFNTTL